MISDREHAVAVSRAAEEFIKRLSLSLIAVQAKGTQQEFERLRRACGEVIGTLETSLLWGLYKDHPDLEPENLRNWKSDKKD